MNIRRQFIIFFAEFVLVSIIISSVLFFSINQLNTLSDRQHITDEIIRDAFELNSLSQDFFISDPDQQSRIMTQWERVSSTLEGSITSLSLDDPQEIQLIATITDRHARMGGIFTDFINQTPVTGTGQDPEVVKMTWSRLSEQNGGIVSNAVHLSNLINSEINTLRYRVYYLYIIQSVSFAIILIFILYFVRSSILRRIDSLQRGTELIGKGDLTYRIEVTRNDEIGVLALTFNQMTENLQETNDYLRKLISNANSPIIVWDRFYKILEFNHAFELITGYQNEEVSGKDLSILLPEERLGSTQVLIKQATEGQWWNAVEIPIRSKEGTERIVVWNSSNIHSNEGISVATIAIGQDITEQKKTEKALQESEERFRILFEQATEAILVYDIDLDKFIDANANAEHLFGCDRGELIKYGPSDFYPPEQPIPLPVKESIQIHNKQVLMGEKLAFDRVIRSMKGDFRYCEVRLVRLPSADRKLLRASYFDITDRKQTEKDLEQYRDHLEELIKERTIDLQKAKENAESANLAKSTFLSSMSHELQTPLNAILGFAQILVRQENLTATQREQLQIVRSSGEHLLNLINDLLDLGRIEAQKMEIQHAPFSLNNAIDDVINITRVKAEEKDLLFQYKPLSWLPEYVIGDERRIKQILLNLLSNAIKYTENGSINLRIWYTDIGSGMLACEVEDTGIGISGDKLEKIFEPFTNISPEGKVVEGAGLGLSITKKLVEMMQGTLQVKSSMLEGSVFRFDIVLPPVEVSTVSRRDENQITGYVGERKKVLVVDDNQANVALLVSLLNPLGFEVTSASDGKTALTIAKQEKPNLILLDLIMPGMDGLEVARILRDQPDLNQIRIIGVSASVSENERKHEFETACDTFVGKPIPIDKLLEKIRTLLDITWIVKPAPSSPLSLKSSEDERAMIMPPDQILNTIVSIVQQGMFSELNPILKELQSEDPKYRLFCEQIIRFARNYDDERIIAFISGHRDKQDHHE